MRSKRRTTKRSRCWVVPNAERKEVQIGGSAIRRCPAVRFGSCAKPAAYMAPVLAHETVRRDARQVRFKVMGTWGG